MKDQSLNQNDSQPPNADLQILVGKLLDQTLNAQEKVRLNKLLLESESSRSYYIRMVNLHARMKTQLAAFANGDRLLGQNVPSLDYPNISSQSIDANPDAATPATVERSGLSGFSFLHSRPMMLIFALVGSFLAMLFFTQDREPANASHAYQYRPEIAARILRMVDCEFSPSAKEWKNGNHLLEGDSISIENGQMLIRFECNTEIIVSGPATIQANSGSRCQVFRGDVTVQDPDSRGKFTIETSEATVTSSGAEYGVRSNDATEVEVFIGAASVIVGEQETKVTPRNESANDSADPFAINSSQIVVKRVDGMLMLMKSEKPFTKNFLRSLRMEEVETWPNQLTLASDGFTQGVEGMQIDGSTGGFGWIGPWRNFTQNSAGNLCFYDNQVVSVGTTSSAVWRHVAEPFRVANPVYFSGIFQIDGPDPICSAFLVLYKHQLHMANDGEYSLATIGISDGRFCSRPAPWITTPMETRDKGDFGNYKYGSTHLIVGKLEYDVDQSGNERLSVWVDPGPGDELNPDKVVLNETGETSFDTMAVRFWDVENGTVARIDDVRLSLNWDEATMGQ